jgi:hypothetical protein
MKFWGYKMMKKNRTEKIELSKQKIIGEIKKEAKVLNLQNGAAEIIAEKIAESILNWSKKRAAITEADLNEKLAEESKKFNEDLAYLFKSRNNII